MAKAIIKSKTGTIITVEGTAQEVSNVLAHFENTSVIGNARKVLKQRTDDKKDQRKRARASDLIINLKEDGFFNKPKGLNEVVDALQEKGYLYPITTLSGVMIGLVQKKLLGRKKINGKWVYGK